MKKGWQTKTLADVLEKTETVNPLQSPNAEFDYIDVSSVSNTTFEIEETQRLKGKDAPSRARKLVRTNDIIFATIRPTLQRIAVVPEHLDKQVCSTGYFVLRPKQGIDHRFVFYSLFTENFIGQMESLQKGASYPAVTDGDVRAQEIPVPPLAEQQRIVGLLDEAFEGLATAKANAEKNLQNARALFESHLQSVFTQRGPGWVEKRLGDVFTTATGTTPPKNNPDFYGDFMPLVKPPELCDEAFDSAPDGLSEAGAAVARTLPAKSILVSCIGNLGKIGLNIVPVAFNQQINAILPDESQAIPEFMFFQSLSPGFKSQLESLASGTTVPIVNKSKFNSVSVVLPPLSIQKPVVAQFSSLREETQHHAGFYEQKHAALAALKKSLLHQAFTGEL